MDRGHALLVVADFYKEFWLYNTLDLCCIRCVFIDEHMNDPSLANILFGSPGFEDGCCAGAYNQIAINKQKFFFTSIHKPPAAISFAPMKHALAVKAEPLQFSPVAYEWRQKRRDSPRLRA